MRFAATVAIPDCCVGAIRFRFREPGCVCATMCEIARCERYTGYRAAQGAGRERACSHSGSEAADESHDHESQSGSDDGGGE